MSPATAAAPSLAEVKEVLRSVIEENAGIPARSIRDDSAIDGDLAMDSLSFLNVQTAVEEHFEITCDALELEARNRFDAIAGYVVEQLEARARSST